MKTALLLGATSGIGRALAHKLVANDYIVAITGRRHLLLEQIKSEQPDRYITLPIDISLTNILPQHLDNLANQLGHIDLLVICSGTGDLNPTLDFTIEKRTIDTNVTGFTAATDWAYNYFETQKSGHLIVITSLAGLRGSSEAPSYSATKAYEINYLEGLRQKANRAKLPIIISDIRPGFVDTDMAKGEGLFWVSTVEKAANQILQAIKKRRKIAYITKRWAVAACLLRMLPRRIYEKM
jgi:short-subunit dehydrogenase